jgi:HAD superfamily hydrolase (TIGR01509 family)
VYVAAAAACCAASKLQRMPGLTAFLQWLDSRQLRRAAVTNAPRDNTLMMLWALGLGDYFEAVVLGEECERAKPHPDPYLKGLQLLGLQPHEVIVIEDSPAGAHRALRVVGSRLPRLHKSRGYWVTPPPPTQRATFRLYG